MKPSSPFDAVERAMRGERSGSSNHQQQARPVRPVKKLVIRGSIPVYFVVSQTPQLMIAGDSQEAVERVRTDYEGDTLFVACEGNTITGHGATVIGNGNTVIIGNNVHVSGDAGSTARVAVAIALPQCPMIDVQGSGRIRLDGINQDELEIRLQGSGNVSVRGQVASLIAAVMGSGSLDAEALDTRGAWLTVTGSGDIRAHARESVRAQVTGSGDIVVWGNPSERKERVTGSGDIRYRK